MNNFNYGEDWYKAIDQGNLKNVHCVSETTTFSQRPFTCSSFGKINSRKRTKRRGISPKVFPYKVRVTEDRVAKDLFQLQISSPSHYQKRQRTISEIESSLTLGSDSEDEASDAENVKLKISDDFRKEIDKFRRNILHGNSQTESSCSSKPEVSKALVVWTPPLLSLPPTKDNIEKEIVKNELVTEQLNNCMDVQFETCVSSNLEESNENYSSVKSVETSTTKTSYLLSDDFNDDDAMEL